jgi:uncharacterized protein (TIGR00297 family)
VSGVAKGIVLAAAVALVAFRARSLTGGGAAAAFAVGAVTFGAGGWRAALVLFAFFIPSVLFSRLRERRKREAAENGKQGPRDAWQVLANGGVAAACALFSLRWGAPLSAAFAGAFAAAAADTWGTEIGMLSRQVPRSLVTLRRIAPGLSGGVTPLGTLATFGGAGCVAGVAALAGVAGFWPAAIGGVAGATLDSLLGATLQALRWCPACALACETNPHRCGTTTTLRRGLRWFGNDAVNFAATLSGALLAGALGAIV